MGHLPPLNITIAIRALLACLKCQFLGYVVLGAVDGVVSPYEFVAEWTCRYGDHPDVAHRIFNTLTEGFSLLSFEMSGRNSENQTVADFRAGLYSLYTEREIRGA
ncbi:uncharacterized protein LOC124286031 [Haliotis rubra]|uniref:uncharacterized protein LOC124286031 n=1 Tax=Haliotis rubra TaxID=36100 RepID=UPI001EE56A2F|nr:uncharacterized protein LOC124286031 [Haliotis rubra]